MSRIFIAAFAIATTMTMAATPNAWGGINLGNGISLGNGIRMQGASHGTLKSTDLIAVELQH